MSVVRKGYVDTSRGQLHYRCAGNGKPLILLQLLPFGSMMFEQVMPILADKGYACYAFDLMGYGRSDVRTADWLVEDFSANLLDAFAGLGLTPEFIVGGHFTSLIAVDLAAQAPDQVKKLVLDGVPVWTDQEREERLAKSPPPQPVAEDGSSIQKTWRQVVAMATKLDPDSEFGLSTETQFLEVFASFLRGTYKPGTLQAFFQFSTMEKLRELTQPTLIVGSPTDSLANYHDLAVEVIPNAQEYRFNTPHPLYRMTTQAPEGDLNTYAAVVDEFIRS